jgi:hypothetical protein
MNNISISCSSSTENQIKTLKYFNKRKNQEKESKKEEICPEQIAQLLKQKEMKKRMKKFGKKKPVKKVKIVVLDFEIPEILSIEFLSGLTIPKLKIVCKKFGITGFSKCKKKNELVAFIMTNKK